MSCLRSPFRKSKSGKNNVAEVSPDNTPHSGSGALRESNSISESTKDLLPSSKQRDSDTAAVDWWRSHQQQDGGKGVFDNSKTEFDRAAPSTPVRGGKSNPGEAQQLDRVFEAAHVPPVFESFEAGPTPSHGFSSESFPGQPQNGMVLDPMILPNNDDRKDDATSDKNPSLGIFQTKRSDDVDMEFFQPQLGTPPSRERRAQWQSHSYLHPPPQNKTKNDPPPPRTGMKTRRQSVENKEKGKVSFCESIAETNRKHKTKSSLSPSTKFLRNSGSEKVKEKEKEKDNQRKKKQLLSNFLERKSKKPSANPKASDNSVASDHLSDVPSDVDSLTRERYLLACEMLKMTIIQKESALIPIEKEYIMSLLDEFETNAGDDSVLSEDHVTAVEHAILKLESDRVPPSPTSAARAQKVRVTGGQNFIETTIGPNQIVTPPRMRSDQNPGGRIPIVTPPDHVNDRLPDGRNLTQSPRSSRSDKNPHTATRKLEKKFMKHIANPCKPFVSGSRVIDREKHPSDELEEEMIIRNDIRSDPDFERIELGSDYIQEPLVRFDGWSFQNREEYPFWILGADGGGMNPRVFTPSIMEALRNFMPLKLSNHNFWLRHSLVRDGGSLTTLLATIRASQHTMIGVETDLGEVFGSFTGTPWRIGSKWYGCNEAFLWRLKKRRYTSRSNSQQQNFEREIEVYPCTEDDDLVQYCTAKTIAVGGGDWDFNSCPYRHIDQGIGFMVDGDLARGETSSCRTFANPRLAKLTRSKSEFVVRNLEVWTLTPCSNLEDATQMEINSLVREYGIV